MFQTQARDGWSAILAVHSDQLFKMKLSPLLQLGAVAPSAIIQQFAMHQ